MKLLLERVQANKTTLQVVLVDGAAYISEALEEGGELVDGEGVVIEAAQLDAVIIALQKAKRELAAKFEAAAE